MLPARADSEGHRLLKSVEAFVASIDHDELREAALHLPNAGGKALRPALAVLACEAAGGRAEDADPVGIAVELLHTFSLVHDDLMDHDALRRGVATVHERYGADTAILAGDVLFAMAFEALSPLDAAIAAPIMTDLAATARALCEGQALDMAFEHEWPDVEAYEAMIGKKTAALFACATGNGARVAGAGDDVVDALTRYGRELGLAFQVRDDVLDLTADTDRLGKPRGSDILAGKKTHPLIAARAAARPKEAERLDQVLSGSADERDVQWVHDLCDRTGALTESAVRSEQLLASARGALDALEDSAARDELAAVVEWAAGRGA